MTAKIRMHPEEEDFAKWGAHPKKRDIYGGGAVSMGYDKGHNAPGPGPTMSPITSDDRLKADAIAQTGHAQGYAKAIRDITQSQQEKANAPISWTEAKERATQDQSPLWYMSPEGNLDLPAPPKPVWENTEAQYDPAKLTRGGDLALPPPPKPAMTLAEAKAQATSPSEPMTWKEAIAMDQDEDTLTSDKKTKVDIGEQKKSAPTPNEKDSGDGKGKEESEAKKYGEGKVGSQTTKSKDSEADVREQDEPTHKMEQDSYGKRTSGAPYKTVEKIPEGSNGGDGFEAKIAAARREGFMHGHAHASGSATLPDYMQEGPQHFGDVNMAGRPPMQMADSEGGGAGGMRTATPQAAPRPMVAQNMAQAQQPTQMSQPTNVPASVPQALAQNQAMQQAAARPNMATTMQAQPAQATPRPAMPAQNMSQSAGSGAGKFAPQQFHDVDMAGGSAKDSFGDEGYHQAVHMGIPEDLARKAYIERRLSASDPASGREPSHAGYRDAIAARVPKMDARQWPEQFSDKDYAERLMSPGGVVERNRDMPGGVERILGKPGPDYATTRQFGEPVFAPDRGGVMRAESPAKAAWLHQLASEADRAGGQLRSSVAASGRGLDAAADEMQARRVLAGDYDRPAGLIYAAPSMRPDAAEEAIRRVAAQKSGLEDSDNPYDTDEE